MAKVLIVEDDRGTQDFLEVVLKKDDHEIFHAFSGKEGVNLAREEEPDVILSDLMLPEPPSDMELLKQLRDAAPDAPIVVISGYPSSDRIKQCGEMGINEFLTKPFEIPFVRDIIRRLAAGED